MKNKKYSSEGILLYKKYHLERRPIESGSVPKIMFISNIEETFLHNPKIRAEEAVTPHCSR